MENLLGEIGPGEILSSPGGKSNQGAWDVDPWCGNLRSRFWVIPTLWPAFRRRELCQTILNAQQHGRRFGGLRGTIDFKSAEFRSAEQR